MAKRKGRPTIKAPAKPRLPPVWARKRIDELEKTQLEQTTKVAKTTMALADFSLKDFPRIERDMEAHFERMYGFIERLSSMVESLSEKVRKLERSAPKPKRKKKLYSLDMSPIGMQEFGTIS